MDVTSPLSSLPTPSPLTSLDTAHHSAAPGSDDIDEANTTVMTTPDDDDYDEYDGQDACLDPVPQYRKGIEPPFELKHGIQIHLEEQLYSQAITLLESLLSDSIELSDPARIATSSQIAFLSTMAIHPHFTSRPSEGGRRCDGTHALSYLRGLFSTVGPLNADFKSAFSFQPKNSVRPAAATGGRRHHKSHASMDDDSGTGSGWGGWSDSDSMSCPFARDELVWLRAESFWSVLGWSFRCAALYPRRWKYWKPWLDFVIGVLAEDWDERLRQDEEIILVEREGDPTGYPYPRLKESMLVAWLEDLRTDRKNVLKEAMRALFAFTADNSVDKAVFKEVFERETVVGPRKLKKRKADAAVLDLENDLWGDYMEVEESESEGEGDDAQDLPVLSAATGRKARGERKKVGANGEATATFRLTDGIAESIPFRVTIFRLLSAAAHYIPHMKFYSIDQLYQNFLDRLRNLPLPLFLIFVDASNNLPPVVKGSLYRMIAEDFLPQNRPHPGKYDWETDKENGISAVMMEHCFLPFAASKVTAEDNAKLSVVLESIMWALTSESEDGFEGSAGMRKSIEKGIKAREDKVKKRGAVTSKSNGPEQLARDTLERSSENLRVFASMLEDDDSVIEVSGF